MAAGDADVVDRAADELSAIGHEHDLVGLRDREGCRHAHALPAAFRAAEVEVGDALPAPPGQPILEA